MASAAGLAYGGLHPVVAIYATFMNRAFDQVLMDVALHPNFAENHWVYFTYNKPGEHGVTIALARGAFDGVRLTGLTDIFVADAWATVDNHSSRIAFAPDGMLYMAVSQRVEPERAGLGERQET